MITIHLHNLKFYSFHGVNEEEKLLGNDYEVNADIQFLEEAPVIEKLVDTINYVDIFEMIKKRMNIPSPLLETVVMDIGNSISDKYDNVQSINISLKKMYPPIEGFQGSVAVTWRKAFR